MFLYWLAAENRYVHRQADVPKGVESERVDVPTDIAGLMAFLNAKEQARLHDIQMAMEAASTMTRIGLSDARDDELTEPELQPPKPPMTAVALLSRVDSPGVNVEGVIEAIGGARGYALARYAGAVAIRYQELEKL